MKNFSASFLCYGCNMRISHTLISLASFHHDFWGRKCGIGNCCYISRYYSLHKAFRHPFDNKTIKPAINYLNVFSIWHQKLFNFWKPNQLIYNVKTSLSFRPHVVLYHSLCGLDSIYWRTSDLVHLSDVPESWYLA